MHIAEITHAMFMPLYPQSVASQGACPNSFSFHCLHLWTCGESIKELGGVSFIVHTLGVEFVLCTYTYLESSLISFSLHKVYMQIKLFVQKCLSTWFRCTQSTKGPSCSFF
jgi:hypothetical protein